MPPIKKKTPFELHVETWKDCTACELHTYRQNIVLARGTVPCQILFIGEGPGKGENVAGQPFVGDAGYLLQKIIDRTICGQYTYAITNLVCCIPWDVTAGNEKEDPTDTHVKACAPRLQEFARVCDGHEQSLRLIVCVGGLSRDWLDDKLAGHIPLHRKIPMIDIRHPASILRMNVAQKGLEVQRCMVAISTALRSIG